MRIIDAEFEDITSEDVAPAGSAIPSDEARGEASRADRGKRRLESFRREMRRSRTNPGRPSRLFPAALAAVCALSFWIFGGHAVFARLTGRDGAGQSSTAISAVPKRPGTIDGLRVAIIDGSAARTPALRQKVPAIVTLPGRQEAPTAVRPDEAASGAAAPPGFSAPPPAGRRQAEAFDVTLVDGGH